MYYQEIGHYNNLATCNKIWLSRMNLSLSTLDRNTLKSLNKIIPTIFVDLKFNGYTPYQLFIRELYAMSSVKRFMLVELKHLPCSQP